MRAKLQSFFEISKCIADFLEYETLLLLQARLIHTEKMEPEDTKRQEAGRQGIEGKSRKRGIEPACGLMVITQFPLPRE